MFTLARTDKRDSQRSPGRRGARSADRRSPVNAIARFSGDLQKLGRHCPPPLCRRFTDLSRPICRRLAPRACRGDTEGRDREDAANSPAGISRRSDLAIREETTIPITASSRSADTVAEVAGGLFFFFFVVSFLLKRRRDESPPRSLDLSSRGRRSPIRIADRPAIFPRESRCSLFRIIAKIIIRGGRGEGGCVHSRKRRKRKRRRKRPGKRERSGPRISARLRAFRALQYL